ncbi:50S ribosomal protein L22 [Candidatus Micrarchaeota archaeon]|nr:50S ribosomal protein L22 [Candidatus Micrarchaeota archaeon]
MPEYDYSYAQENKQLKTARAQAYNLDASYKDLSQVCANIKGKMIDDALELLESASEGKRAIKYKKFNKKLGHRRELGGKKGRYPWKAAKMVLKVVQNAQANASFKGLYEALKIVHASANKQATYPRMQSKGRQSRAYYETARVEVVVREMLGAKIKKKELSADEKKNLEEKKEAKKRKKEEKKKEAEEVKKEENKQTVDPKKIPIPA